MSTNSNSNQQHLPQDGCFNAGENSFLGRAPYAGYDPNLQTGQRANLDQSWNFAPGRLEDPMQIYHHGWSNADAHNNYNLQSNAASQNKSDLYGSVFPDPSTAFHNMQYGTSTIYSPNTQSQYMGQVADASNIMDSSYQMPHSVFPNSTIPADTVSPGALQSGTTGKSEFEVSQHGAIKQSDTPSETWPKMPKGTPSGKFNVVSKDDLAAVTKCRDLHNFVSVLDQIFQVTITKTTIPAYIPRKSRNEIKRLLATDDRYSAKVAKKPSKRGKNAPLKPAAVSTPPASAASPASAVLSKPQDVKETKAAESSSEAESSDEESDSGSEEETMAAPLPDKRPTNPFEAVKYDTVKKLWRVPYRSATVEDIRQGLADFWDIVRTIRDRWKSDSAAVKQAEELKKASEVPFLKERVSDQRNMLEAVLQAAMKDGHKDIVEHFGENLQFILSLAQFLQDRARDGDYNGSFTKTVLELLSKCKTLTDGNLEKTGVGKILPRFLKRGDESVKLLSKRITDNATAATKKRREGAKSGSSVSLQTKDGTASTPEPIAPKTASPVAGIKRLRTSEGNSAPPIKKVAAESTNGKENASKTAMSTKKAIVNPETKLASSSTTSVPIKTKAHQVIAKPSGFFSSLQPASKKTAVAAAPPSTVVAKAAPQSNTEKDQPPTSATAATPAQSKPAFSFAATIASLNKPKEAEPVAKPKEVERSETPEERAKRLRKEERRKLRVSFKPEASLVQIRYFVHDPEEELGHDASQVRDVGDVESEGRMFKLKHQERGDMLDLDDSDEDEQMADVDSLTDMSQPFPTPTWIDFEDVPTEEREKLYTPYGGGPLSPDCPEKWIQEQREQSSLSVIYTDPSEIPPSPKEPPTDASDNPDTLKSFGTPPEHIISRLSSFSQEQTNEASIAPSSISSSQLSALLSAIPQANTQTQQSQPLSQQVLPSQNQPAQTFSELEKIFAQYSQPAPQESFQPPQAEPPPPQQQPQSQAQPQSMATPFPNLQNFLGMTQSQAQPNPVQQPTTPDISSILASLQQSGLGQMPSLPNLGTGMGGGMPDLSKLSIPGFPQLGQQLSQHAAQQQQPNHAQSQPGFPYENEERKRWREAAGDDNDDAYEPTLSTTNLNNNNNSNNNNNKKRQWGNSNNSSNNNNNSNNNNANTNTNNAANNSSGGGSSSNKKSKFNNDGRYSPPKFVVQCKYWKDGKCKKGDACTFRHDNV